MQWNVTKFGTAACIVVLIGCKSLTDLGGGGEKTASISNEDEALAAFLAVKYAAEEVDQQVSTNFSAPYSVSGIAGTANVSGRKTYTTTSSSSSSSSTNMTDIYVSFISYQSSNGLKITGTVRWFDYSYFRTSCSGSFCASSSDDSEAMEGTVINVAFEHGGKKYEDVITIDGGREDGSFSWDVTVTNKAGFSYSFRY